MKDAFGEKMSQTSTSKGLKMPKINERLHNPYHENHLAAVEMRRKMRERDPDLFRAITPDILKEEVSELSL